MRDKTDRHSTLCWDCEKQFGGCAWSREFKPVEGWKAIPTKVKASTYDIGRCVDSFDVYECPEFELRERLKKKRTTEKPKKIVRRRSFNAIKQLLSECGISQAQLASKSQVAEGTVSRFVNCVGIRDGSLKRIADALGVSVEELEDKYMKEGATNDR